MKLNNVVCRQILFYPGYCTLTDLLRSIQETYDLGVRSYISFQKFSWVYKNRKKVDFDWDSAEKIISDRFGDLVRCIHDSHEKEEQSRTYGAERAKADGYKWLIIQDIDETYPREEYNILLNHDLIFDREYRDLPGFKVPWNTYWKNWETVIVDDSGFPIVACPEFGLNLSVCSTFRSCRAPSVEVRNTYAKGILKHGSYVLTDEQCWEKINTWGHAHQFDTKKWFETIWKQWDLSPHTTRNLHPINPPAWPKAEMRQPYDGYAYLV